VLNRVGLPPFAVVATHRGGEIGAHGQQFLNRLLPGFALAKLAERRRSQGEGVKKSGRSPSDSEGGVEEPAVSVRYYGVKVLLIANP
jgi:hypothetical protein